VPKVLDIRTATTDVQDAIVRALELAYLRRYPEAVDLTALALVDSEKLPDRALVYVQSEGVVYRLSKASTLLVALPDIVPAAGNGRWLRQTSTMTMGPNYFAPIDRVRYGVVNAVEAFQGDMSEFLDRLITIALPRVRDFRGVSAKSFDGRGNYSLGIKEQIVFPEIDYDKIDQIRGMDIVIVTTARTNDEAKELLKGFGMPFIN
jgi:hypothetical protein